MDRRAKESYNNMLRVLLIWVIRVYPILTCLVLMVNYAELIHAVNAGEAVEYYEGDTLLYVQYETQLANSYLASSFLTKLPICGLIYLLSKVYLFCKYHRVFIFAMFVNELVNILNDRIHYSNVEFASVCIYTQMAFLITCFMVALYLHQKYGDRETICHRTISSEYRNLAK